MRSLKNPPPSGAGSANDRSSEERSRFEKWATRDDVGLGIGKDALGDYYAHVTDQAWFVWRAALEDRQEAPKWQRLPDEQAWWWHWNGEDWSVPHIYCVMVSKTGRDRYFIAHPDSRWCDEMGGAWLKLERPNVPERGVFKPAEDRQGAAPVKEVCPDCKFEDRGKILIKPRPGVSFWCSNPFHTLASGVPSEATKENL